MAEEKKQILESTEQEIHVQHLPQVYIQPATIVEALPAHLQLGPVQPQYYMSQVIAEDLSMNNQMFLSGQSIFSRHLTPSQSQSFCGGLDLSQQISIPSATPSSLTNMSLQVPSQSQAQINQYQTTMQQQQQQRIFLKPWHSLEDINARDEMAQRIIALLQQRKPSSTPEWQQKLPQMAKRLEDALYSNADSMNEYQDLSSLKRRLQEYAMSVGSKQNVPTAPTIAPDNQIASTQPPQQPMPMSNQPYSANRIQPQAHYNIGISLPSFEHQRSPHFQSPAAGMAYSQRNDNGSSSTVPSYMGSHESSAFKQQQRRQEQQQQQQQLRQQQQQQYQQQQQPQQESGQSSSSQEATMIESGTWGEASLQPAKQDSMANAGSDEHRKAVLKQQQQRLLLLRHASKCPHENCTVTQHCASMKTLWKHIMSCKAHDCKLPHCVSSRYVLSHYSKCKETNCPVCGPVREAIKRNYEKSQEAFTHMSKTAQNGNDTTKSVDSGEPKPKKTRPDDPTKQTAPPGPKARQPKTNEAGTDNGKIKVARKPRKKQDPQAEDQQSTQLKLTIPRKALLPPKQEMQQPVPEAVILPKTNALDPISCSIYSFSNQSILAHLKNIHEGMRMTASEIRGICLPIVENLLKHPDGYVFAAPVDPVLFDLHDYFEIVKMPMDLGTVKKKLETSQYRDPRHVAADVQQVFDNAILYNPKENHVHKQAVGLKRTADNQFNVAISMHETTIEDMKKSLDSCSLCGEQHVKFEPPVYYCEGKCGAQRIRRNAYFYASPNGVNKWCSPCFSDMKEFLLTDGTVLHKSDIAPSKKKHQEESEESWVSCDICKRWVHQICGLFNSRRNTSEEVAFVCPTCILDRRRKHGEDSGLVSDKKMRATDLPHTNMSLFMERRIEERLQQAYTERAVLTSKSLDDVEICPQLSIRQVASIDKMQQVREGVKERYKHNKYPTEFPCRTKCIVLFQNIDGQDVILFGMYVYEYGHRCPPPNQRRVYVSYLDSVHYFRPRQYRTTVYQEIIVAYLEYVKNRGFHTAHIWACPPLKGDDYILYCHPGDQKTPKEDRLRQWYVDVLKTCKDRGIVTEITDLYTEFMADPTNDATVLPYFEGDYWVNEAEVVIKDLIKVGDKWLATDGDGDISDSDDVAKSKAKPKRTRSGKRELSFVPGGRSRDAVMAKLAPVIQGMKEAFFVARLHPKEYAEKWSNARQIELETEAKDANPESEAKRARLLEESALKSDAESSSESSNIGKLVETDRLDVGSTGQHVPEEQRAAEQTTSIETIVSAGRTTASVSDDSPESKIEEAANLAIKSEDVKADFATASGSTEAAPVTDVTRGLEPDAMVRYKNDLTDDIDDIQENDYFNTRQDVLNLCQGNHYQFDQLRRAKHTSMMILYHLHNPDAPKFVPICSICMKEILVGYKHRCENCDVDVCHTCYSARGSQLHPHPLRAIAVNQSAAPQQLTDEQRKERQRSIEMHLHLLKHASSCVNKQCGSKNCVKMREFLRHGQVCSTGAKGGCPVCKRIFNLLTLHSRACKLNNCGVQRCHELREQMRKMEMRQQQMDDRRRAMMNHVYNHASTAAAEPDDP